MSNRTIAIGVALSVASIILPAAHGAGTTSVAATYYVAAEQPGAADSNPGTESAPFKTISAAVARVQPGDTVLVKNGTYRESVLWDKIDPFAPYGRVEAGEYATNRVLATARMTLAAYPGQRPVIKGSEIVTNRFEPRRVALRRREQSAAQVRDADFMRKFIGAEGTLAAQAAPEADGVAGPAAFSGIYACPWPSSPVLVFADQTPLKQIGLQGAPSCQTVHGRRLVHEWDGRDEADMRPGTFYFDAASKMLYVWMPDGGDPNRHLIEAGARGYGLKLGGTWTVRGFDVRHTIDGKEHFGFFAVFLFGNGSILEDCHITHNGFTGLMLSCTDTLVRKNEIAWNGGNGLSSGTGFRCRIENNDFHHNSLLGGLAVGAGGNKVCWWRDGAFIGNRFSNEIFGLWMDLNCNNMLVAENEFDHVALGVFFEISRWGVIVNNVFRDCEQSIQTASSDALIAHNVILGGGYGIWVEVRGGNSGAFAAYKQTTFDTVMEHPSFFNDSCLLAERNNLVLNNIILNTQTGFLTIQPDSVHACGNYSDYNVYAWTLPAVQSLTQFRFISTFTNYRPTPAIRLGAWRQERRNDEHSLLVDAEAWRIFNAGWVGTYEIFPWEEIGQRDLLPEIGFTDPAKADYRLRAGSPVCGRGIALPLELNSTMIPSRTTELNCRAWARTLTTSKSDPRFRKSRYIASNGSESYRIQPLPAIRRLVDLDAAAPADPGINFEWRRKGQYPRFRAAGEPETAPDDTGIVYANNRLQDPGFDRKIGEAWKLLQGQAQIFQSAAVVKLSPADAVSPLVAQKIGILRADTEYLGWADLKLVSIDSHYPAKGFIALAAGPDMKRLVTTEVTAAGGQSRHWNTYALRYRAGRDAQTDPAVGQDLFVVFGASLDGPKDLSKTSPAAVVTWDKVWVFSGEPPASEGVSAPKDEILPFAMTAKAAPAAWKNVDLTPSANRPLRGEDAWVGLPLSQIAPGDHVFAGVPFRVLAPTATSDMVGVALRSAKISATRGKALPAAVELPATGTARAVYFLHGAGWITTHKAFAKYTLVYADGSTAELPILCYGKESEGANVEARKRASNVQDWWPTLPHFSNQRVRAVPLDMPDRAEESRRFLYAVEWPNPHPEKPLKAIRLSSDPGKDDSLIVLAVTLLK